LEWLGSKNLDEDASDFESIPRGPDVIGFRDAALLAEFVERFPTAD
jgi:hypothetical protein